MKLSPSQSAELLATLKSRFEKHAHRHAGIDWAAVKQRLASLDARNEHKPKGSAVDLASSMGIELLTESDYRQLQLLGEFDTKTSSWVATPADIRKRGDALFCDRRYGHVFVYHNGAQSYYAARGFRGLLRL